MRVSVAVAAVVALAAASIAAAAALPSTAPPVTALAKAAPAWSQQDTQQLAPHPRLILTPSVVAKMRDTVSSDGGAKAVFAYAQSKAEGILPLPPMTRNVSGPGQLLDVSRAVVDRVHALGITYAMTNDTRFARRGILEALAAANFTDWNPPHFLDVGEMTYGVAVAYDWFYTLLSAQEMQVLEAGLLKNGLQAGLTAYKAGAWWWQTEFNWNQVCNGGLAVGALAVADSSDPTIAAAAAQVLTNARTGLPHAFASYGPAGEWPEGTGYWGYATVYAVRIVEALRTATGDDWGLSSTAGFDATCTENVLLSGAQGHYTFNFYDSGDIRGGKAGFWEHSGWVPAIEAYLANRFDNSACAWWSRFVAGAAVSPTPSSVAANSPDTMMLAWYAAQGSMADVAALPRSKLYDTRAVGVYRSTWLDMSATFVGFKGGDNSLNHGHLDEGSFVYDDRGVRWAMDMGSDNYGLPGYFGPQRFTYYRLNNTGHNTLTFGPGNINQGTKAVAPITVFNTSSDDDATNGGPKWWSVTDLTATYAASAAAVQRGVAVLADSSLLVRDDIQGLNAMSDAESGDRMPSTTATTVRWAMHTIATLPSASVGPAELAQSSPACVNMTDTTTSQQLQLCALSVPSESARAAPGLVSSRASPLLWAADTIELPKPNNPVIGVTRMSLVSDVPAASRTGSFVVWMGPPASSPPSLDQVNVLSDWGVKGPLASAKAPLGRSR